MGLENIIFDHAIWHFYSAKIMFTSFVFPSGMTREIAPDHHFYLEGTQRNPIATLGSGAISQLGKISSV